MNGVNKHILAGHVGAAPKVTTKRDSQDKIVSFSLATTESWRDKDTGERREQTAWHRIVIFNPGLAEVASQYVKKGSKLYIEGQVLARTYKGDDGVERTIVETVLKPFRGALVLLDKADRAPGATDESAYGSTSKSEPPADFLNDDIPF